uniref:Zinc finger, CCHC-type n=1 Tax=Tanacetum cinerariifolium TaxID=118510 RepID=A0A699HLC1_TANCI|nr:zinc finger, CCHC-type [Tanacetum cinerariifolium]
MAGNTVKEMTTNFRKLDKFEGHDFRRWQKKIHFVLTMLKVVYVLTTPMSELMEDLTVEAIRIREKWENDDYICRGHILNGMSDYLFDVYTNVELTKELWGLLESKYMAKDYLSKKFINKVKIRTTNKTKERNVIFKEHSSGLGSNKKPKLECWKCGKTGHFKRDCRSGNKKNANTGGSGKGLMQLRGGLIPVLQLMFVKIVASLRHMNWWNTDLYFTWVMIISLLFMEKEMLLDPNRKTLGEKGIDYIFVGYAEHSKAYSYAISIDDEIGFIMENNTWVLSDLLPGCNPLRCKWIFKRKMKVDGTIDKFKARLVIQGFRQKEWIDYFYTYAPIAHNTTIRLWIALAAIHNLVIHQMDVKTTFLNGDLDEEVYMNQPEGFVMPGNEHKVCKLVKSLYGLKQAPKQWHQKFDEVVLSSGFLLNQSDKCVYSKFDSSGKGVIICLYVDDMLIFGTDQNQVDKTIKFFVIKVLNERYGRS